MWTVPRAGQTGFHQRTEYDKRIMVMGNADDEKLKINPEGGYKHFRFSQRRFHYFDKVQYQEHIED